jgi:hypothetical protein
MADDTENHTIKLLQDMRCEMRDSFSEMRHQFDEVNLRIDGLTYITTMLAGNMGGHEDRITDLEAAVEALQKD